MLYIFDWDGTISDSTARIVDSMHRATVKVGLPELESEAIKNIIGLALPEAIRLLYPNIGDSSMTMLRNAYSEQYLINKEHVSRLFDDVMDTLVALKKQGHTLSVATGMGRGGLDRAMKSLNVEGLFDASRCANETASKPDPLMLRQLLSECNVDVEHAVMVGDTQWDMVMADRIGMSKIAVTYGAHSKERLRECSPDMCIDRFADILMWRS